MNVEVLMPKMGESITEGRILKWNKMPGDAVDKDETILEIATDKVDTEVPSPASGILVQHLAAEGDTVEVGKPVAIIETEASAAIVVAPGSASSNATVPAEAIEPSPAAPTPVASAPMETSSTPSVSQSDDKRFYSPVVMRIAADAGIGMEELATIPGTGANGRVTKTDITGYLSHRATTPVSAVTMAPSAPRQSMAAPTVSFQGGETVQVIPMDNMKRLMAEHMVHSVHTSPHVTLVSEVDMTAIARYRAEHAESFKAREGVSLTFMPFIAEAAVRALRDFPFVNASIDGTNILVKKNINLGIAVAMEDGGLIVPVVRGADQLNPTGLARSIADLARRARHRRLQPEEIQDGTFTITNFGVFGNLFGTPIINQPQVAILGVGSVTKRPVVIEQKDGDVIAIRSMMYISLSFDHRLVDGALGGMFLERVVSYLEEQPSFTM